MSKMSQGIRFYNNAENCVDESLSGLVYLYPGLKLYPPIRLITRVNNQMNPCIGILSGGGSGHEPFCAGYVGEGMLAGAVAGNIFASPPKSHILQSISHLHKYYKGGILVIIPNYTGDCLNFGMAIEHAKKLKLNVESFIVGEDYASGQKSIAGKRGMCGLLCMYKIGGAMASRGRTMNEIIDTLSEVLKNISTLGISARPCSLPGQGPLFQIETDEMELGTGVHGEAGIERVKVKTAEDAVNLILKKLCDQLNLSISSRVVVFVNNLGTTTELEQNIICHEIYKQLSTAGIVIKRIFSGMLMTSLDMAGFQISILKLTENFEKEWIELLDEKTDAPRWIGNDMSILKTGQEEIFVEDTLNESLVSKFVLSYKQKDLLIKSLKLVVCNIVENEFKLNELDSGCGDGDCGTTLKHLAEGIEQLILVQNFECPAYILNQLSEIAEKKMGGTSGAIYNLFFFSVGKYLTDSTENSLHIACAYAFKAGLKTIMKYSRARKGDRTMIDALEPAIDAYYQSIIHERKEIKYALEKAKNAAESGCVQTKSMKARAGRASYVSEERLTDVDAGAYGIFLCLKAINECFQSVY